MNELTEPKQATPIMTPDHPEWEDFCDKLWEELEFRGPNSNGCKGDHFYAMVTLPKFGVDVDKSIAFFEEHGGYCDCEILLNVLSEDEIAEMEEWAKPTAPAHECHDPRCVSCSGIPERPFNPETDSGIWWLSFAQPICKSCKDEGQISFLGVAIVPAGSMMEAIDFCWTLGINPGGEVQGSMLPKDKLPPEHLRCLLLSRQELREAGLIK